MPQYWSCYKLTGLNCCTFMLTILSMSNPSWLSVNVLPVTSWCRLEIETLSVIQAFCGGNPPVAGGFPFTNGQLCPWCLPEETFGQTVELPVIWDAVFLMWRHCNVESWRICMWMRMRCLSWQWYEPTQYPMLTKCYRNTLEQNSYIRECGIKINKFFKIKPTWNFCLQKTLTILFQPQCFNMVKNSV